MTTQELIDLGNDQPVLYRMGREAVPVTFVCLSMAFRPWSGRKQPMMADIRLPGGIRISVFPKRLSPVSPSSSDDTCPQCDGHVDQHPDCDFCNGTGKASVAQGVT